MWTSFGGEEKMDFPPGRVREKGQATIRGYYSWQIETPCTFFGMRGEEQRFLYGAAGALDAQREHQPREFQKWLCQRQKGLTWNR